MRHSGRPPSVDAVEDFVASLGSIPDFTPISGTTPPALRRRVDMVGKLVQKLSGGSDKCCAELLHAYLKSPSTKGIATQFWELRESARATEYESLVAKLGKAFTSSDTDAGKRTFLQFVCEKSRDKLRGFGFTSLGKDLLNSVRTEVKRDGFVHGLLSPRKRCASATNAQLPEGKRARLRDVFYEETHVSSSRVGDVALMDDEKPRRVLEKPRTSVGDIAQARGICTRHTAMK